MLARLGEGRGSNYKKGTKLCLGPDPLSPLQSNDFITMETVAPFASDIAI